MSQLILLIHVLAAAFIIVLVLIQQGKGATVGAAFGSGASQTVFGSRGSGSFLFRLTIGFIIIFFTTSILLNYLTSKHYKQENLISLPIPAKTSNNNQAVSVGRLPSLPGNTPVNEIPTKK